MTLPAPKHQNLEVTEFHFVGDDHNPVTHHTMQRLHALVPIESFPYRFDTSEVAQVTVEEGGQASDTYPVVEGVHAVDIIFDQPLDAGDETTVVYTTEFGYAQPPAPELRRQIGPHVLGLLDVTVVFEASAQPDRVWRTQWESRQPDSPIVDETLVHLEPFEGRSDKVAINADWRNLSNTTVGFRWEWPTAVPEPGL